GSVAGFFSILSIFVVQRFGSRKAITLWTFLLSRLVVALLIVLLFLKIKNPSSVMLWIIFVSSALGSVSGTAWFSWITSIIPGRVWGRYFSRRQILASVIGMFVPLIAGWLLDHFKKHNLQKEGFFVLFGTGIVLSTISFILLRQIPEEKAPIKVYPLIGEIIRAPFLDRDFMKFNKFAFFFTFFNSFASPFYLPHMITNLRMSFAKISVYGFVAGGIGLFFRNIWGKLADIYGPRPLLRSAMWGIFPLPLLWLLPTPSFHLPIWIDAFITGVFWSGVDISIVMLLLGLSKKDKREAYYSAYTVVTAAAGFLGSMFGGAFAKSISGFHIHFLGQDFRNYHIHFVISSLSRLWTMRLAMKISPEKTEKAKDFHGIFPVAFDELWKLTAGFSRISKNIFLEFLRKKENSHANNE
ncbi:MAG: MFS transporter, partial [bacterium]